MSRNFGHSARRERAQRPIDLVTAVAYALLLATVVSAMALLIFL
jgi:hypothetical protein